MLPGNSLAVPVVMNRCFGHEAQVQSLFEKLRFHSWDDIAPPSTPNDSKIFKALNVSSSTIKIIITKMCLKNLYTKRGLYKFQKHKAWGKLLTSIR